ncbi:MAG TPA: hypothetical protein VFI95_24680 [Terriglobales bacterium]|nr:hypothetical protein [Terriglobales bacterium]
MNALEADALKQLANCGARIVGRTGDPRSGFHFDYKINESVGSLTILPLAPTSPAPVRNMSLPEGMEDVTVRIEQMETWFPTSAQTSPTDRS